MQLTAFSGRGMPLAERLVFNNRYDNMKIRFSAADTIADDGAKLLLNLYATDEKPTNRWLPTSPFPLPAKNQHEYDVNNDNMVSSLLLSSDLKGFVEDPYDYFSDNTPFLQQALDNLMLTNGWRRFDWSKILAGRISGN